METKSISNFPLGHVVKDYYVGNTHIIVCDDYCRGMTKEQVQAKLDRIAEKVRGPLIEAMLAKEEEERARLGAAEA